MQRAVEIAQLLLYLLMTAVVLLLGIHGTTVLTELSTRLQQENRAHEQMLRDHVQQLKDHERQMERR